MDLEGTPLGAISDRDVEDDRADLDDIIVPKHRPFDSLSIHMRGHTLIQAFQNSVFAML